MWTLAAITVSAWVCAVLRDDRIGRVFLPAATGAVCALVVALRSMNVDLLAVSDRMIYVRALEGAELLDSPLTVGSASLELDRGFQVLLWVLGIFSFDPHQFFVVLTLILFAGVGVGYVLASGPWAGALGLFTLAASGLMTAYGTVAVRQGVAVALLFAALGIAARRQARSSRWVVLLAAGSCTMHWSAIPFAVLLLLASWKRPVRLWWAVWVILVGGFLTGVSADLAGRIGVSSTQFQEYTSAEAYQRYGSQGSSLPLLVSVLAIGLVAWWGSRRLPGDPVQEMLTVTYLSWSSVYLVFGSVAYSDRIVSYVWFLAPLLLWRSVAAVRGQYAGYWASWLVVVIAGVGYTALA